jgi:fido (protein-threonine AMPylation protein)
LPRGRPSLEALLERVDEQVGLFHRDYGGLPRAVEADQILREIWIEDTYHSSALEGNPLSKRQVAQILEEGRATGTLTDSLEIEGYGKAARWVYAEAPSYPSAEGVPLAVIQTVHRLLLGPAWALDPPDDGSMAGSWRKRGMKITGSKVRTTPPIAIDGVIQDWIDQSGEAKPSDGHVLIHAGRMHAWFERIHPFADGNGRTGRLLLNFTLIQRGYPPAVLVLATRKKYLEALARADAGSPRALTELVARAIESSLNKFLIPSLAGDARLVPLAALAEGTEFTADYLRTLVASDRLHAVRDGRIWLSSRLALEEYRESRSRRGRKPARKTTRIESG